MRFLEDAIWGKQALSSPSPQLQPPQGVFSTFTADWT